MVIDLLQVNNLDTALSFSLHVNQVTYLFVNLHKFSHGLCKNMFFIFVFAWRRFPGSKGFKLLPKSQVLNC